VNNVQDKRGAYFAVSGKETFSRFRDIDLIALDGDYLETTYSDETESFLKLLPSVEATLLKRGNGTFLLFHLVNNGHFGNIFLNRLHCTGWNIPLDRHIYVLCDTIRLKKGNSFLIKSVMF